MNKITKEINNMIPGRIARKAFPLILAMLMTLGLAQTALAETVSGTVTYDGDSVDLAYSTGEINARLSSLTPGDEVDLSFVLSNDSGSDTDWYVEDNVIRAFEDESKASSGAYNYKLTYKSADGSETDIYSSEIGGVVSGAEPVGLHQASSGSERYFYLDKLSPGAKGELTLAIAIDGESLDNSYQSTIADLDVNFAVEEITEGTTSDKTDSDNTTKVTTSKPKTGDYTMLTIYIALFAVTAILLAAVIVLSVRARKRGAGDE